MQFTISINQKAFQQAAPECDIIDAAIFDFISRFMATNAIENIIEDGQVWYWISYKKIIDELPILGLKSKRAVYNRMEKLIQAGLLKRYSKNQKRSKSYFKQGEKFQDVIWDRHRTTGKPMNENSDPSESNFIGGMNKNSDPPMNKNSDNHIYHNNQSTSDHVSARTHEGNGLDSGNHTIQVPANSKEGEDAARLFGVPVPEALRRVDGFVGKYREWWEYMRHVHKQHPNIWTVQEEFLQLTQLHESGDHPVDVIRQSMKHRSKSLYAIRDDGSRSSPSEVAFQSEGRPNAGAYNFIN